MLNPLINFCLYKRFGKQTYFKTTNQEFPQKSNQQSSVFSFVWWTVFLISSVCGLKPWWPTKHVGIRPEHMNEDNWFQAWWHKDSDSGLLILSDRKLCHDGSWPLPVKNLMYVGSISPLVSHAMCWGYLNIPEEQTHTKHKEKQSISAKSDMPTQTH